MAEGGGLLRRAVLCGPPVLCSSAVRTGAILPHLHTLTGKQAANTFAQCLAFLV